jgi:hypothetical protein
MGESGSASRFLYAAYGSVAHGACEARPVGPSADDLDEKDEEEEEKPPTLRGLGPAVASATSTAVVSPLPAPIAPASAPTTAGPRRRRSLLLVAAFVSSVAMMFVLGWWQGTQHTPPMTPAAATSEPGRSLAHGAARTPAPSAEPEPQPQLAEPEPQPQVAKPAPTNAAIPLPMPRPTATSGADASVFEPMGI